MHDQGAERRQVEWRIVPSGDSCLVVEVCAVSCGTRNEWAGAAAAALRHAALPGVTDVVPAMVAVGVHYRPDAFSEPGTETRSPFYVAARLIESLLGQVKLPNEATSKVAYIPVCYGGDYGPDLIGTAQSCGVSAELLVELHTSVIVKVQMIGFAPGHPYIGEFDVRLAPPRLAQPRTSVPAGAVGLANRQSVIYPFSLPGGWNLIGRTPLKLFDPLRQPACLLKAGDLVQFVPISAEEFESFGGAS